MNSYELDKNNNHTESKNTTVNMDKKFKNITQNKIDEPDIDSSQYAYFKRYIFERVLPQNADTHWAQDLNQLEPFGFEE